MSLLRAIQYVEPFETETAALVAARFLGGQDGCLAARVLGGRYGRPYSVQALFEIDGQDPSRKLPDGCRFVHVPISFPLAVQIAP